MDQNIKAPPLLLSQPDPGAIRPDRPLLRPEPGVLHLDRDRAPSEPSQRVVEVQAMQARIAELEATVTDEEVASASFNLAVGAALVAYQEDGNPGDLVAAIKSAQGEHSRAVDMAAQDSAAAPPRNDAPSVQGGADAGSGDVLHGLSADEKTAMRRLWSEAGGADARIARMGTRFEALVQEKLDLGERANLADEVFRVLVVELRAALVAFDACDGSLYQAGHDLATAVRAAVEPS